jgi:hypothetical protein
MMDDLERELLEAGRAEPGADVRARVLAAAMPLVRADDSRLDRIWFSVRWRAAAALSLLVLAGVDRVTPRVVGWAAVAEDHLAANTAKAVAMAARDVGLPPDDTAVLVAQAVEAEGARR